MARRLPILLVLLAALAVVLSRAPRGGRDVTVLGGFGRGPTVVLVHGLGSGAEHWLPAARDLARDHRVVLVQLPGHGGSPMSRALTLDEVAAGLDRALAAEGGEPVTLVGHSVGGLVALAQALRDPERLRGLVLVETALRPMLPPDDRRALLAALDRDYRGALRESYAGFGRDSAQGAALYATAARQDSSAIKTWIRLAVSADLSESVAALRVPMLVVLSDRSWPGEEPWAACAESLGYARAPRVTPVRVEGTGHFVMLDRPRMLAGLVRRFERSTDPPLVASR